MDWIKDYPGKHIIYDRSEEPLEGSIVVPNVGSDIYDKFTFIIHNYDNLPEVAIYTKANLFKYTTKEEFDTIKDNNVFTPITTKTHQEKPTFFYRDGLWHELNDYWYLSHHPAKRAGELIELLGMKGREYNAFAPGSNYIIPKENILKHPKSYYEKLRSFLDWSIYPGEAQILERNLYYLWS